MINFDTTKTRTDLINSVARKINAKKYLEIGCSTDVNFINIDVPYKVGVDPVAGGTHRMTSDEYFTSYDETFDLIFVDGLHHAEQVVTDVHNSIKVLNEGGVIIMHDCLPTSEYMQLTPMPMGISDWTGDVWKAAFFLHDSLTFDVTITNIDWGCGIVINRQASQSAIRNNFNSWMSASYDEYCAEWKQFKLKTFDQALEWI